MKKWWMLWLLSIPLFFLTYLYSFFIGGKVAYLPQDECKPMFIFTPQNVQYCSEIYAIDVILLSFKNYPISYLCLLVGLYIIGFIVYQVINRIKANRVKRI